MRRYQKALIAGSLIVLAALGSAMAANAQNLRRAQQARLGAAALGGMFTHGAFVAGLNLTNGQKEQVKAILAQHKEEIKAIVQETAQARKNLREALAGGVDQVALKVAYDQVSAAGWQALSLRNQIMTEIKPVLTAEQLAKLQKRLQNIKKAGLQKLAARKINRIAW
jgi:Spy/CpxP family protein refolding chaperone